MLHQIQMRYLDEKLSGVALTEKNLAIKQLMRDYPGVSEIHCSWIYDFVTQNPEEAKRIMESGEWDGPSMFSPEATNKICSEVNDPHSIES